MSASKASTELIKREILRFLDSEVSETLCIRGKWGVGKTYSWKLYLEQAQEAGRIKLNRYAYVSLFGINSLDELKYSIFENTVGKENVADDADPKTLRSLLDSIEGWGRKGAWLASFIPSVKPHMGAAGFAFFLTVRNQIICIDDLERRGAKLDVADILGLISFLKDQRKCKVVLLLNDGALEDDARQEFWKYFEKVIDVSIEFAPTPTECAAIALTGASNIDAQLRGNCTLLGIANIRIIKKIERIVRLLEPMLKGFEPELISSVLKTVVLLGWVVYAPEDAPAKDFVLHKYQELLLASKDAQPDERELTWNKLLNSYGFSHFDELDLVLLEGIESGFFDDHKFAEEATKLNNQILAMRGNETLKKAWQPYHDSFEDNVDEVIDSVFGGCMSNIQYVSVGSLDAAVSLLKDLDAPEKANDLLKLYIERRKSEEGLFDLSRNPFASDIKDPDVIGQFRQLNIRTKQTPTPLEALEHIARRSWGSGDIGALKALSVDEFYLLFKSLRGDELYTAVTALVEFGRISNLGETERSIYKAGEAALKRVGKESALNRRRVRKFGISID